MHVQPKGNGRPLRHGVRAAPTVSPLSAAGFLSDPAPVPDRAFAMRRAHGRTRRYARLSSGTGRALQHSSLIVLALHRVLQCGVEQQQKMYSVATSVPGLYQAIWRCFCASCICANGCMWASKPPLAWAAIVSSCAHEHRLPRPRSGKLAAQPARLRIRDNCVRPD